MAKKLLLISGLYLTAGKTEAIEGAWGVSSAKKGLGGRWSIMDNAPGEITVFTISPGYIRAGVGQSVTIPLKDIASVDTCEATKRGKKTAVHLTMKDGSVHMLDVKKENKADDAVATLKALLA